MKNLRNVAKSSYRKLPYHNFEHALEVEKNVTQIIEQILKSTNSKLHQELQKEPYEINELKELLQIAALFHDAGHGYLPTNNDEEYSAILSERTLKQLRYKEDKIKYVKKIIMATVFIERWNLKNIVEKIIADADIMSSFRSFDNFLKDNLNLLIESLPQYEPLSRNYILKMTNKEWFINFLRETGKWKLFLLEESNLLVPNAEEVIVKYQKKIEKCPEFFVQKTKKQWEKFYWDTPVLLEEI